MALLSTHRGEDGAQPKCAHPYGGQAGRARGRQRHATTPQRESAAQLIRGALSRVCRFLSRKCSSAGCPDDQMTEYGDQMHNRPGDVGASSSLLMTQ